MQITANLAERHDSISQLASPGSPVLIFEIDAAGFASDARHARGWNVRLVGCVRDRSHDEGEKSVNEELSAVLVLRGLTPSRLLSSVRAVTRGEAPTPPELLRHMFPSRRSVAADIPDLELTEREIDVLRMLSDGEVTRGIAQQLNYSERTVKNIVRDVLVKLDCRTRAHAVALATRQGVI
jgi:DNA-binding NarL/FixJ family response regulator